MIDEQYQVEFDGNRLDLVPNVDVYNYDFTRLPRRDLKVFKIARRDLSILTSGEYIDREIPVWLDICSGTRQDTEATLTAVKALVQKQNGLLRVLLGGEVIEFTATLNEFNTEWNGPHAYCNLIFLATTPLGQATTSQTLFLMTGITGSTSSAAFVVDGSFTAEPVISISINAVTGGTGGSINIYNGRTNQGITVTANQTGFTSFAAGGLLEIDSSNYTVQYNGINVDFTGLFPTWPAGTQSVAYSDTFTTRTVDVSASYKPRS